jgi:hypothetical protein
MAGALAVLGAVLVGLGALTEAEAARCESMRLWQSLRGAEHFEVGVALTNLAAVQHARDDLPAARSHCSTRCGSSSRFSAIGIPRWSLFGVTSLRVSRRAAREVETLARRADSPRERTSSIDLQT